MLVELLVSVAIVLALLGTVFGLVDPTSGVTAVQSEAIDVQQRQRAALGELQRDLLMAGSGPHPGLQGTIAHLRPAVMPALRGAADDSAQGSDRVSGVYGPPGTSNAELAAPLSGSRANVALVAGEGCAALPCGLTDRGGGLALVYGADGRSDLYRVEGRTGANVTLEHVAAGAPAYAAGSLIAPVVVRGYYHDAGAEQLRVHNGAGGDLPVVEGVVGFTVRYFGVEQLAPPPAVAPAAPLLDPVPPAATDPMPPPAVDDPPGAAPCLAAAAPGGVPRESGIVELDLGLFTDGPWCGGSGAAFDVDLFRVRRVRVDITLRVADDAWRRTGRLGPQRSGRSVPLRDVVASLDVAPRALVGW